ncbi:MAG: M23 family metallopeptidase [Firmicutes bacterium]|nr:M23 family metallopeptidase [Bacillota bacterium]
MSDKQNKVWMRIRATVGRIKIAVGNRWRRLAPGIRYALVYLVAMISLTSLMWWWFNPARFLDTTLPPTITEPEQSEPSDQDEEQEDDPQQPTDTEPEVSVPVVEPVVGQLRWPLKGELLTPGQRYANNYTVVHGVHIAGNAGDEVRSAWHGTVESVSAHTEFTPGEIVVSNGAWSFVYRNLDAIYVVPGDSLQPGAILGTLCARKDYPDYTSDYLEFGLKQDNVPENPLDYLETESSEQEPI